MCALSSPIDILVIWRQPPRTVPGSVSPNVHHIPEKDPEELFPTSPGYFTPDVQSRSQRLSKREQSNGMPARHTNKRKLTQVERVYRTNRKLKPKSGCADVECERWSKLTTCVAAVSLAGTSCTHTYDAPSSPRSGMRQPEIQRNLSTNCVTP